MEFDMRFRKFASVPQACQAKPLRISARLLSPFGLALADFAATDLVYTCSALKRCELDLNNLFND